MGLSWLHELLGFARDDVPARFRTAEKLIKNLPPCLSKAGLPSQTAHIHVHNNVTFVCFDLRVKAPHPHSHPASFFDAFDAATTGSNELRSAYFSTIKGVSKSPRMFTTQFTALYATQYHISHHLSSSSSSLLLDTGAAAAMDVSDLGGMSVLLTAAMDVSDLGGMSVLLSGSRSQ